MKQPTNIRMIETPARVREGAARRAAVRIFRADGDVVGSAQFEGKAGLAALENIAGVVTKARVMQGNQRHVSVTYTSGNKLERVLRATSLYSLLFSNSKVTAMKKVLPAQWQGWKSTSTVGTSSNTEKYIFGDQKQAKVFADRLNNAVALYQKVCEQGATTSEAKYSGAGRQIEAGEGDGKVTFMQTYDQAAFDQRQKNTLTQNETDRDSAATQAEQAKADQAAAEAARLQAEAEQAAQKAKTQRTLRVVAVVAVAVLLMGAAVLVAVKAKKK